MCMVKNNLTRFIFYTYSIIALSSCMDDTSAFIQQEGTFVTFGGIITQDLNIPEEYDGDATDYVVRTLRILAFDQAGNRVSNVYYNATLGTVLKHELQSGGTYKFVFLANEPSYVNIKNALDNITVYTDLQNINYPEEAFTSETIIPMIQEIEKIQVLSNGKIKVNDGPEQNTQITPLELNLRRLAARLDIVLKAKMDLSADFSGITLSKIPNVVPLTWGIPSDRLLSGEYDTPTYTGAIPLTDRIIRDFTLADHVDYFEEATSSLSADDRAAGMIWAMKIKRIILPSNYFSSQSNKENAIVFTVNVLEKYSPSCELKIKADNYTLPANARLELVGLIDQALDMNITYKPWDNAGGDWEIAGLRKLNISHTKASITDLNGVRISFSSNMPRVRVLPTVTKDGVEMNTNLAFNDLALAEGSTDNSTTRFAYNPTTGTGYMDVIVDGGNATSVNSDTGGTYKLTLSAENEDGSNPLQREIEITVSQLGYRFRITPWVVTYSGVFFRHNQKGERIITAQLDMGEEWTVTVPNTYRNWIVISSTPSFDPGVGTDDPGNPENYLVTPNQYKEAEKNGYSITGKGRVYFRIGLKKSLVASKDADPKYGYVVLRYRPSPAASPTWYVNKNIYVRQGEAADYLYRTQDPIVAAHDTLAAPAFQPLKGETRQAVARFSPFNLTAPSFKSKGGSSAYFEQLTVNGGEFVEYPSQGGSLFPMGS